MTPEEVGTIYAARRAYDETMFFRPAYDAARMTGFLAMLPHVKARSLKHPTDLWKFSWEDDRKPTEDKPKMTPEELKAALAKLDQ